VVKGLGEGVHVSVLKLTVSSGDAGRLDASSSNSLEGLVGVSLVGAHRQHNTQDHL